MVLVISLGGMGGKLLPKYDEQWKSCDFKSSVAGAAEEIGSEKEALGSWRNVINLKMPWINLLGIWNCSPVAYMFVFDFLLQMSKFCMCVAGIFLPL